MRWLGRRVQHPGEATCHPDTTLSSIADARLHAERDLDQAALGNVDLLGIDDPGDGCDWPQWGDTAGQLLRPGEHSLTGPPLNPRRESRLALSLPVRYAVPLQRLKDPTLSLLKVLPFSLS